MKGSAKEAYDLLNQKHAKMIAMHIMHSESQRNVNKSVCAYNMDTFALPPRGTTFAKQHSIA